MNSSVIVALVVIILAVVLFVVNKNKAAKSKNEYRVPLSDDVQKMYYDKYEAELEKEKQEQSQSSGNE